MKKLFETMSYRKGETAFVRVLLSWRLWLFGAFVGAILSVILVLVLPTKYTTFATVIVDHNREQAWVTAFDKELFFYYDVENRKLEGVANGDAVMQAVVDAVPEVSVLELREGMLRVVRQSDGIWELHVVSEDAGLSRAIAKAWAETFTNEVMSSLSFEKELEEARAKFLLIQSAKLCEIKESGHGPTAEDWPILDENAELFKQIVMNAKGISPYVEIVPVSVDDLAMNEMPTTSVVLFAGIILGMVAVLGMGLVVLRIEE